MNRIHIVGISPRTGTTLLAECMAACFEIEAHEEHEKGLNKRRWGADLYLTKAPADLMMVGPRLRIDPRLNVICMIRDPRDVIVSRHDKDRRRYWVSLRIWKSRLRTIDELSSHPRFLLIRYEDLVREPDAVQARIEEHIPFLKRRAAFSSFHQVAAPSDPSLDALGGLRPIGTGSIGSWRRHLPRVAGQLKRHGPVSDELIRLGYETDASWVRELEAVEPDLEPSHYGDAGYSPFRLFLRWKLGKAYPEAIKAMAENLLRLPSG